MQGWALVPIVAIIMVTISQIARMKYGGGWGYGRFGRRDQGDTRDMRELEDRLAQVEQDLQTVRQELLETQERVDFTERLLAKQKDSSKLPS